MKLLRETIRKLILQESGVGFDQESPVMKNYKIPVADANQPLEEDTRYEVSFLVNNSILDEVMTPFEILSTCQDLTANGQKIKGIFITRKDGAFPAAFSNETSIEYVFQGDSLVHVDSGKVHYR